MSGNKLDSGKLQYHLIPPLPLRELARVFSYGAALPEYGPWNWHKGLSYSRLYDAAMRHIEAWRRGEKFSEHEFAGANCYHLAHACFSLFCILQFELEGRSELDNVRLSKREESADIPPPAPALSTTVAKPIPRIPDYDQEAVAQRWRETFGAMISDEETVERLVERLR